MTHKVKGSALSPDLQREVKAKYVHRFTGDHKPAWSRKLMPNGREYPLQFIDDSDWLEHSYFVCTKAGVLSRRDTYCESYPTWPNNPEMQRPHPGPV